MIGGHGEFAFGIARPLGGIAIDVEFDAVAIGIAEVESFANAVVRSTIERDFVFDEAEKGIGQRGAIRVENGDVIEAGGAVWRGFAATAFPGVEADVVMITAGGDKRGLGAVALGELETEDAAVEGEGALQIGHLQMNVADADAGVDGGAHIKRR